MFTVNLIGNLGRDAQMVTGASGRTMTKLVLAVSSRKDDRTLWFDVLMNYRPNLEPYLIKGQKIYISGDADASVGNGYLNLNVFANTIELLGSKADEQNQDEQPVVRSYEQPGQPAKIVDDGDPFSSGSNQPAGYVQHFDPA